MYFKLPNRIVASNKYNEKLAEFETMYKKLVVGYSKMPFHCGPNVVPLNPKEISEKCFMQHCEKMKSNLMDDQKRVWDKMYSEFLMNYKPIKDFFELFPEAEFSVNEKPSIPPDRRLKCLNKNECLQKAAIVDVPQVCWEYYHAINDVQESIKKVNEIETKYGLQTSDPQRIINELISLLNNPETFADKWLNEKFGKIQKNNKKLI